MKRSPLLYVGVGLWLIAMVGFGVLLVSGNTNFSIDNGMKSYANGRGEVYPKALYMVSPNEGWSVGYYVASKGALFDLSNFRTRGAVLHYLNGQWSREAIPDCNDLTALYMTSATEGWAIGDQTTILHYANGQWSKVDTVEGLPSGKSLWMNAIQMLSPSEGWIVGANWVGGNEEGTAILHYSGGQWHLQPTADLGVLSSLDMISASEGWASGYHTILHYSNGQWAKANTPALNGDTKIQMVSSTEGWAADDSSIFRYQAGSWAKVSTPTLDRIWDMQMVGASDGWAVGDDCCDNSFKPAILRYHDGQWVKMAAPGNEPLYQVFATRPDEAWVIDSSGTIMHYQDGDWSIAYKY